jgi:hypothetical protein
MGGSILAQVELAVVTLRRALEISAGVKIACLAPSVALR